MKVLLMQPINYPNNFLDKIIILLQARNSIKKAFFSLAQFQDPRLGPDFLIALEVEQGTDIEIQLLLSNLPKLAECIGDKRVTITDVNDAPFKKYFSNIDPFYMKS